MKLLVVSQNVPRLSSGANTRNYHLLRALAQEHTVALLALVEGADVQTAGDISHLRALADPIQLIARPLSEGKRLKQLAQAARGRSYMLALYDVAELRLALNDLMARHQFDAVLFESVFIAGHGLPPHVPVIIDQHNIEYLLYERSYQRERRLLRRWYNWRESRLIQPVEVERCRRADLVLVTSEPDGALLQRLAPTAKITVVPNGVDTAYFQPDPARQSAPGRLVFTGAMDYYPNVDGVTFFARECWPRIREQMPEATWQIVGRNPVDTVQSLGELPGVTVTGSIPDVRPYLAEASVAIAPLRIGGGTRLKILEALAMRRAVVATSTGAEGLAVTSGEHLLIADEPDHMADAIVRLLADPAQRAALGVAGRALAESQYSWERSGATLTDAVRSLPEKGTPQWSSIS